MHGFRQKTCPEYLEHHRKSVQNWSKILPTATKNDTKICQNASLNRFRCQIAARSAPGRLRDESFWILDTFFQKMTLQGSIFGPPENPKSLQKRTLEDRRALGPSKNGLWEGVRQKRENLIEIEQKWQKKSKNVKKSSKNRNRSRKSQNRRKNDRKQQNGRKNDRKDTNCQEMARTVRKTAI